MTISLLASIFVTLIGSVYTFSTFMLADARVGIPYEPKVFPAILGISLLILGFCLIVEEIKKNKVNPPESSKPFVFDDNFKKILYTILNGFVYALLFDRIGYVFSTIVFLEVQLDVFRGFGKWKNSTIVAVSFSLICYFIFSKLGIFLPVSFLGII